jgi:uncharacterized protein
MKKIIIILFLFFALPVLAYYNPGQPAGLVNDYTGTLTNEQKQALENKLVNFEKQSTNEIAVVIIPSLNDDTIENFAVKLFEDWQIGKKGKDNGVLILVAKNDREMRLEVGYGLEGALTDAQSNWIINQEMKPAFQNNDFYGGLDKAVDQIILATKGEYVPSDANDKNNPSSSKFNPFDFLWFGIFIFIWLSSILGRSKSWWAGGVIGGIIGIIIGIIKGFLFFGLVSIGVLIPLGLLFDFIVSKKYQASKTSGHIPWWIGGGRGGSGGGFGGFGGFGGGFSGGGGSSGRW